MKNLPNDEELELMWRVAVTSSISTGLGVHKHYAWMLYNYITDKQFPIGLCDDFKGKESTAEKT